MSDPSKPDATPCWFDAHLDLAYLAVNKRQMLRALDELSSDTVGVHEPASVTLPSLRSGGVRFALGTIFAEADGEGPHSYATGDAERAYIVGRAQLEAYLSWCEDGHITLDLPRLLRREPGVGTITGGMGVSEVAPVAIERRLLNAKRDGRLHIGILMENADPIREPGELEWWASKGVIAIGMAWAPASRYAGGNLTDEGVTPLGRELVREIDRLRLVHDASHLSPRALDDLLGLTDRPIVATHSNCRSLLGGETGRWWRRHVDDAAIKEIARRGGVIGLNLCGAFLVQDGSSEHGAVVDDAIRHIEHICELTGGTEAVGLGSDMDGGFSATGLPAEIRQPADLERLAEALMARGWSASEVEGFRWKNWARAIDEICATKAVAAGR